MIYEFPEGTEFYNWIQEKKRKESAMQGVYLEGEKTVNEKNLLAISPYPQNGVLK